MLEKIIKRDAKKEHIMSKKVKTTSEKFLESLSKKEREEFEKEYKEFVLSELLHAIMEKDEISVRKLAKLADLSPTVIQAMRTGTKKDFTMKSFFKVLKGLGCKKLMAEIDGEMISLSISY